MSGDSSHGFQLYSLRNYAKTPKAAKDNLCNHTQLSCQEKSGAASVSMDLNLVDKLTEVDPQRKTKQDQFYYSSRDMIHLTKVAEGDNLFPKPKGFQCYLAAGCEVPK